MSETKIRVHIVTPYELFYEGDADMVVLTALDGEIGILPGHNPVIVGLSPGEVRISAGGEKRSIAVSDGYADITGQSAVIVVNSAEWPEQIDLKRANEAMERAVERLNRPDLNEEETARAKRAVLRAKARIKAAEHAAQQTKL